MAFAHLKIIFRLARLRLRGPRGAQDEFLLAATAQNLKKLAKYITRPPPLALAGALRQDQKGDQADGVLNIRALKQTKHSLKTSRDKSQRTNLVSMLPKISYLSSQGIRLLQHYLSNPDIRQICAVEKLVNNFDSYQCVYSTTYYVSKLF